MTDCTTVVVVEVETRIIQERFRRHDTQESVPGWLLEISARGVQDGTQVVARWINDCIH